MAESSTISTRILRPASMRSTLAYSLTGRPPVPIKRIDIAERAFRESRNSGAGFRHPATLRHARQFWRRPAPASIPATDGSASPRTEYWTALESSGRAAHRSAPSGSSPRKDAAIGSAASAETPSSISPRCDPSNRIRAQRAEPSQLCSQLASSASVKNIVSSTSAATSRTVSLAARSPCHGCILRSSS